MSLLLALLLPLAAGVEPSESSTTLHLATFNIHHAEGRDGVLDLDRVARVVRKADIVAFQEVDVRFGARSRFVDQAEELGKTLQGEVAFGGNLVVDKGEYGVALVSKFPILSRRNHPLPRSPGRESAEPRGLLEVRLDVRGRPIRVLVTHLAHDSGPDRTLQIDAVRQVIRQGDGPFILMGDFNLRPDSEAYRRLVVADPGKSPVLVDSWTKAGKGAGPTIGLEGKSPSRIDYIFVSPDLAAGLEEIHVDTATIASDHQPVFASLRIDTGR